MSKMYWETLLVFLVSINQLTSANEKSVFSLLPFGECVIHFTTFFADTKLNDLVQNFVSENPNAIWTFTNQTNQEPLIQPTEVFFENCSVNVLLNSERSYMTPTYFIWSSMFSH